LGVARRPEIWLLGGIFLAALLLLAFGHIAEEVIEGDAAKFDQTVMLALRNPSDSSDPLGPAWLEEAARDITGLGGHVILSLETLASIAYLLLTRKRGAAFLVIAAVGGGMLLSSLLKLGFERPRPDLVPHGARVYTASCLSGHAMLSAVTYLTLGALLARVHQGRGIKTFLLGTAVVLTVLIGASRERVGFDRTMSLEVVRRLAAQAIGLFPFLADVSLLRTYLGFRPYCPDHLPVIGEDPRAPGLIHACGHEGAGIGLAAATAHLLAQHVTGRPTDLDLAPFRPDRFTEDAAVSA